ncbi:MAG: hypothetical protein ACREBJ_11440 [Nitrosotalea sp.]
MGSILGIVNVVSWATLFGMLSKALNSLHAAITTNVLLFLVGLIILFWISKYYNAQKPTVPQLPSNITDVPASYQEYLKYKQLDEQYNNDEQVNFKKFFSGFTQPRNWYKSVVIGIMLVIMCVVGFSVYREINNIFGHKTPPVASTITNSGTGSVDSKTESKAENKQSAGLNLGIFNNWF